MHILRPSGAELALELEEGSTVLDAKKSIEAMIGVHVAEQKLFADDELLDDDKTLSVAGLAALTLVHVTPPPWCWPCREVLEPTGAHKLLLFEDPEVTSEDVFYPSPWDEEFDETIRETWRKRGLRCTPGFGLHAGQELSFEYLTCQCLSFDGSSHGCEVFRADAKGDDQFVSSCLRVALKCPKDRIWPEEVLKQAIEGVPKSPMNVKIAALETKGVILQVSSTISFAELYHIAAAALFRTGHHFPDGFVLWTDDGCALLPTSDFKLLQPALRPADGSVFSCVAVSHSIAAIAFAGVGMFTPATVPAKEAGSARFGICFTALGRPIPLPGMAAWREFSGKNGHGDRSGRHRPPVAVAMSEIGEEISSTDDFECMPSSPPGVVVQLFKISSAGVLLATVRETSDGNMVGGSYSCQALPADATSSVIRGLLVADQRHLGWWRLASARDHHRSITFDELGNFPDLSDGLCICRADNDER